MRLRRTLLATLLPAALLGPAVLHMPSAAGGSICHSNSVTEGKGQGVEMRNNCFSPMVLQAAPDKAVTFLNRDVARHTVTGAGDWGTGFKDMGKGQGFQIRFPEPGLYLYSCVLHPGMIGAVYVGPGRGIEVADSKSVSRPLDLESAVASDGSSSEAGGAEALEVEAAASADDTSDAPAVLVGMLAVAALGAGYGLGRLRRRTPAHKGA